MSELIEFFAKYAVVQAAVAVVVILWGWQKIIRPGEKDVSDSGHDVRARWKAQQDISDIAENVKTLVTYQKEIRDAIRHLVDNVWNDRQHK
jgi:putative intracellular protease/amidase